MNDLQKIAHIESMNRQRIIRDETVGEHVRQARDLYRAALAVADSNPTLAQQLHSESFAVWSGGSIEQQLQTLAAAVEEENDTPDGEKVPVAGFLRVDGVALRLVNWFDFRGFEVRQVAKHSGDPITVLGYIIPGSRSAFGSYARVDGPDGEMKRSFTGTTAGADAIRFLIAESQS